MSSYHILYRMHVRSESSRVLYIVLLKGSVVALNSYNTFSFIFRLTHIF